VHIGISGDEEHARWLDSNVSLSETYHPELNDHDHSYAAARPQWRLLLTEQGTIDFYQNNRLSFICAKPSFCSDNNG